MINKNSKIVETNHGVLNTPFFMPDATRGFVKSLVSKDVADSGIKACVVNTFHLYLQPGIKTIKKAGGIHKYMNWDGPLLSDSGGYQVFSLIHKNPKMGKITDKGAIFKSPIDGSMHEITPEKAIQIQFDLGVDMMVCLDDCPPNDYSREAVLGAVNRTISWAKRCKIEYEKQIKKRSINLPPARLSALGGSGIKGGGRRPLIFSVIQGGTYLDLRERCAEELSRIGFDGYGFGARHVNKDGKFLEEVLRKTAEWIPNSALKFALGVGAPEDIVRCYQMGWNMFDCVIPTREGRHGKLFFFKDLEKIKSGKGFYKTINIGNSKFINDFLPINPESDIKELREYNLAFLHHLFKMKEPLGARLASLNNLEFYSKLIASIE